MSYWDSYDIKALVFLKDNLTDITNDLGDKLDDLNYIYFTLTDIIKDIDNSIIGRKY